MRLDPHFARPTYSKRRSYNALTRQIKRFPNFTDGELKHSFSGLSNVIEEVFAKQGIVSRPPVSPVHYLNCETKLHL